MKQRLLHLQLLLLVALFGVPLGAWADRDVNQQQFGKQVIEVASDEVITFYDPWGTENIVDNNSYNAQSLTVFKPAETGKSVQITFEEIDLNQFSDNYFLYINLYDGIADAGDAFSWATKSSEVNSSSNLTGLSGTLMAEKINNKNKPSLPAVYTSGTSDGALSVAFMHRNSNKCTGWKATVKVVTLENMTVTGAGSSYENVSATITKKQDVDLATAFVTTTGVMNPDKVTSISFSLTKNEGVVDPTALKLYYGDAPVSATVSEDGSGYKFTLNQALSDGTNNFVVKGDILATAAIGAKVQLDVTKITTEGQPGGVSPFAAGTSVAVENPAIVIMTSTPQTITVGETPLQFYDEGGKDGGILSKTNGQVTFLSGVEGKKVMVDFTNNSIWHGSYYNQELRIYKGQTVSEANLLKTLQKGETAKVRSTADDGSLTVVLFSDASNDIAADGFEAEVSLFTPQAMDFDGVTASAAAPETVAASDAGQDFLTVTVKAKDTEPAMQVTKMAFSAEGTSSLISKASIFFGSTKVGETEVNADNFVITLTAPQTLVEGENIFTLKYDIFEEALNGQKVSAKAVSVTALVNGAEKTENVADGAVAESYVKNEVFSHADQGTVTKTVNGAMDFFTMPKSEYSENYEGGTDDRVNIFVPKHEGMICQIDFSMFAIYYSSYSPSSCAKFKIYSGQGTSGEVLWEPKTSEEFKNGPGKTIRSTAADGALTISFNPNNSYSSAAGWEAVVSEYQSKPMTVAAVEVAQASTADASIGASNQDLLTVNVKTDGDQNPLTLSSVKVNLKGTEANLSNVSLWQAGEKLGEAAAAAEVTISLSEPVALSEGDNKFTVKADVSSEAAEGQTIDAKMVSVNTGSDVAVESGDPEGARTLKNMILIGEGDNGVITLAVGQKTMFYDDGGPEGDGTDGLNGTITFAPKEEGSSIRLTNQGLSFAYTAHLYIYEGSEVNDEKLIVDLTGSSAKFDPIVSDPTKDGGKITVKYVGAGSYTRPNFAIEVEGYKKKAVEVVGVATEDISTTEVLKGQTEVKMLKVTVETEGDADKGTLDITAFNLTAGGEAIDANHIYCTDNASTFSPVKEFSEKYTLTKAGTYYFWICSDMKTDAEVGQTGEVTLNSIATGETTVSIDEPATASVTIASGKSGEYTVGQGGDYATIQGAIDDLGTLGMEGPVTLKIKAGEYNEKVRIPNIKGLGATNTLTLQSESGQRDVKIFHNNYTTGGYSDDQHKKDYGVVTLYEANYVTLKDLEIYTTDKAYKAVVMVKDESRHATIDNCYLHAPICTASSGEDVVLVGHTIIDEENRNNDYLTVKNCLLEGGKMGVSMGGTSYVALPKEVGGVIEGNTFKNNGQKAIYVMDELGVKIRNNTVNIDADAETKISVGILDMQLRDEYDEATEITGNIFNVAPKTYCAVMNLRQLEGKAEAPVLIANNVINLASLSASYAAFKFNGAKVKNVNVAYNTIRMTGANGGAAFWASSTLSDGYGNVNVVNNIIQNETNGYAVNLYNDANLGTDKLNFQNNVIFTNGETFFRAASGTTGDFAAFEEKTGATANVNKKVEFLSEDILEPANDLDEELLKAQPLSYVTTDIVGKERPVEKITIGAYEYDPNAMSAPVIQEGYPKIITHLDGKAAFTVKTDLASTLYYIVKKADEAAPTVEELKASETKKNVAANAETVIEVEELEGNADYKAYFLPVSLRGVDGVVSETETFTMEVTPPETLKPEAMVFINNSMDEETVESGTEVSLMAMVTVDETTAPYVLTWMDQKHNVLKTETFEEMPDDIFTVKITPTECTDYIFMVTDNAGKADTATVRAIVTGEAVTATFETLYVDPEDGFWPGSIEETTSTFVSGSYKFDNGFMPDWNYWYNFSYSNSTSTLYDGKDYFTQQFNNAAGGGYDGSENYVVSFPQGGKITVLNNPEGDELRGMFITNDAWNVYAYTVKDDMTKNAETGSDAFDKGDWCKLTVTADNGKSVEVYLADYRQENPDDRYYLDTWQWVDLSPLGTVKTLQFFLSSSRNNSYGMTTPGYFCLDNFNSARPEKEAPTQNVEDAAEISLADLFTTDATGTVVYALADELPSDIKATVTFDAEAGKLIVEGTDAEEFTVVVSCTQKGKTQYLKIPVSVAESTSGDNSDLLSEIEEAKKLLKFSMPYYDENNEESPETEGKALVDAIRDAESLAETPTSQKKLDMALADLKQAEIDYTTALMEYELAESEDILAGADPADELAAEIQRLYDTQDVVREDYSNQPKHIKNYADEIDKAQKAYLRKAINELMPEAQAVAGNPDVKKAIDAANKALENDSSEELFDALNGLLDALETATGIRGIESAETDVPVYNMAGQRVSKHSKGIVIKNGKKYVK